MTTPLTTKSPAANMSNEKRAPTRILNARSPAQVAQARRLMEAYAASLEIDLSFQDFDEELASLPGGYAPPDGCLLLAMAGDAAVGCIALRKFEDGVCEMKRMYVVPAFRRQQLGRTLAIEAVAQARKIGYAAMRLDTDDSIKAAIALYRSLGFREIGPYRYNPAPGAIFMELDLTATGDK